MTGAVTRRDVLRASALLGLAAVSGLPAPVPALATPAAGPRVPPAVKPRAAWAGDLAPRGALETEAAGDVRFLLVHHSATPNEYAEADVPALLRGFYDLHTGPERGWPDIAYNFLVDAYGGIWEGRQGSATSPVKGSATGGSQGFAMLCCYIGDFRTVPPTPAAEAAMLALLAWLADTYDVDTAPGAVTSFVSRGSNRHPAGTAVTARTLSAHRDMSRTECPGDVVYAAVVDRYPQEVSALRQQSSSPGPAPTEAPTDPDLSAAATGATAPTGSAAPGRAVRSRAPAAAPGRPAEGSPVEAGPLVGAVAAAVAAVAGATAVLRRGRAPRP